MALLHVVNKSPYERNSLSACLRLAKEGSSILLIEDGVIAAADGARFADAVKSAMAGIKVSVLGPDLDARGISRDRIIEGIDVVGYDGFVDLVAEHDSTQSWV